MEFRSTDEPLPAGIAETQTSVGSSPPLPAISTQPNFGQPTGNWILWGAFLIGAVFYLCFIGKSGFRVQGELYFSLFDDAMVSMRYAQNLATGHGLVWNPGEHPVEGYTNPLWTLWMCCLHWLPLPEAKISLGVMVTGMGILFWSGWLVFSIGKKLTPHQIWVPVTATILTMWYYPLIFWTLRGMEVGLLTALLLCGVKQAINLETNCHSRSLKRLAMVMGLCLLTRTDALIPCSLLMFFAIVRVPATYRLQVAMWCGAGLVGTLALHTFFRFAYYGDWLPNTYYLKMTGVSLGERLSRGWSCLQSTGFKHLYAPVGLSFFAIVPAFRPIRSFLVLLAMLFTAQCGYSVYVGGDAWELPDFTNRYLCIAMPLLFLLSGVGIQGFWGIISKWIPPRFAPIYATLCGVLLVLALNSANFQNWQKNGGFQVKNDGLAAQIGLTLRNCTQPEASIGVVWAGATPYFAHRRAIDLLGKSDRVIAHGLPKGSFLPGHNKWDYNYSIGQLRPDVIIRLWNATDADYRYLQMLGYRYQKNRLWVNPASPYLNPCIQQSFTL